MKTLLRTISLFAVLLAVTLAHGSTVQQKQSTLFPYQCCFEIQDDFVNGFTSSTSIGLLGWITNGGTTTGIAPETNHPGLYRRDTSAVSGTATSLAIGPATRQILGTENYSMVWIVRLNTNDANTSIQVGALNAFTALSPNSGEYFEKLDADTNWFCVNRNATVQTRVDSGVAVTTNFVTLEFNRNSSGMFFKIDGVSVCNSPISTNLGTFLIPGLLIINSAAAAKTVDIDYFQERVTSLTR